MKPHGTYKLRYRQTQLAPFEPALRPGSVETLAAADGFLARLARSEHRIGRILASLRDEILEGGGGRNLRIRQVFQAPREVYRLELELPELGYQRTTFLDRDALEELLEEDDVREVVEMAALG
jgi:hypothetical protein